MPTKTPVLRTKLRNDPIETAKNAGFTLVEVMIVIVIIGIVAALVAPTMRGVQSQQSLEKAYRNAFIAFQRCRAEGINYPATSGNPTRPAVALFTNGFACIIWDDLSSDGILGNGSPLTLNLWGLLTEGAANNEVVTVLFQEKFDTSYPLNSIDASREVFLDVAGSQLQPAGHGQTEDTGFLFLISPGGYFQSPLLTTMAYRIELRQPLDIEPRFADPGFHPARFCVFPSGQTIDWMTSPGAC